MAETGSGERFDVAAFIDDRPIGWREITTLVVVSIVLFIDGFDMYFFGKILPAVADGLGVTPAGMAGVVTAQQVGMAIGAFLMPPLADRIGRKPVLAICLLSFGILSLWTAYSTTPTMMAWLRGISGIFFSAMLPISLAFLAEMTPRRRRASFMAIALVCFSGANVASGAMTAWMLDIYGWQIGFWLGGLLPLLGLPLLLLVHESLPFRVARNPADPQIAATIQRIDPQAGVIGGEAFHLGEKAKPVEQKGPLAMFSAPYRLKTAILWCACFLAMGNIALLANWLPTYFQELGGVPIQEFAKYMMIGFVGGALGTLSMGWWMDRVNPHILIATFFFVDALAIASLGFLPVGTVIFVIGLVVWNYCQVGGQTGINTIATLGYPPEMRSSGIGWAGGSGRIGGIAFPAAGAFALQAMLPLQTIMVVIAIPAVLVAVLILWLGAVERRSPGVEPQLEPATA
ncbi:MFS transporter [Croceibacterium sp. LX-88]|jgi:AAHS family 4-hydroxybenzoate transporter-like MFS transporter|uniref:MFS transporter n=1 Tax=Croceibacterium selenioxidans TaxID=2838833 RepID=A0ABS5W1C9_9SPHN|nr:MFS transporter [Croceibacterium selenioxidans]MBT2133276.1 MFS transporter [Croceibacterium selenioxidans]